MYGFSRIVVFFMKHFLFFHHNKDVHMGSIFSALIVSNVFDSFASPFSIINFSFFPQKFELFFQLLNDPQNTITYLQ